MPDVLAGFAIHDDDALRFLSEIDEWDGIGRWERCGFGGAGQSTAQGREEQESIHKVWGWRRRIEAYRTVEKRNVVIEWNFCPGRRTVEGNSGWFGASGGCWVSRQNAGCLPQVAGSERRPPKWLAV